MLAIRIWVLLLLALTPLSQASPIHHYQLKNGLQLTVKEDHRAPVVFFSIWYKIGSSYESNGITGISHVLEHMMFRGTQKYPAGALEKIVSDQGGQQNAMTADDYTVYFQSFSADALPVSFELESDRLQHLLLNEKDFTKEIQVVMEERRMRVEDDPLGLTYERLMAAAYLNNPYHHPTIGWMTDLKHMTDADLKAWYQQWYAPNNAIIVVVGDVKPSKVLALANKYFGKIPTKSLPMLKPRTEVGSLGTKQIEVEAPAQLPILFMSYDVPSIVTAGKDSQEVYALDVLSALLGRTNSARLAKHLIRGKQIASTAQVEYDFLRLYGAQWIVTAIPVSGHTIHELQQAIATEIDNLKQQEVSAEELKRVKAQIIAENVYKKDSLMSQAMDIGLPESIGLSPDFGEQYVKNIEGVTAQQVRAVAQKYLTHQRLTIAVLRPTVSATPGRTH